MSQANMITETMLKYPELKIIDSQKVYKEKFGTIDEQVFFKTLSRLEKKGDLKRISKGVYCKPKKSRFGVVASGENDIIEYLLGKKGDKGVVVGYKMYSKYGLTTQVGKTIEAYSNVIDQDKRKIRNVEVRKAKLRFDPQIKKLIELLEVLENYQKIEDLNRPKLFSFLAESFVAYNEKTLQIILKQIGYKKSTLASLKNVLDYFKVNNSISNYLKATSTYSTIDMEELYDITSKSRRV